MYLLRSTHDRRRLLLERPDCRLNRRTLLEPIPVLFLPTGGLKWHVLRIAANQKRSSTQGATRKDILRVIAFVSFVLTVNLELVSIRFRRGFTSREETAWTFLEGQIFFRERFNTKLYSPRRPHSVPCDRRVCGRDTPRTSAGPEDGQGGEFGSRLKPGELH